MYWIPIDQAALVERTRKSTLAAQSVENHRSNTQIEEW